MCGWGAVSTPLQASIDGDVRVMAAGTGTELRATPCPALAVMLDGS